MFGRPVFVGSVQLTSRLGVLAGVADTAGRFIVSGGSSWSVTFSVTVIVSELPLLSTTLTVAE